MTTKEMTNARRYKDRYPDRNAARASKARAMNYREFQIGCQKRMTNGSNGCTLKLGDLQN